MKEYKELVQLEVEEHDVLKLFNQLGPNAKKIVIHILERLAKGAKQYGDFNTPRNWDKESSEEALDLAVYQAAKLLGLGKATEPEDLFAFGHSFIDGKRYTRFHEGPSYVTLVDADGRTSDGMPWVPPAGARVRVVARSPKTTIDVGDILTFACSWKFNETWVECCTIAGAAGFVRVVPAYVDYSERDE